MYRASGEKWYQASPAYNHRYGQHVCFLANGFLRDRVKHERSRRDSGAMLIVRTLGVLKNTGYRFGKQNLDATFAGPLKDIF